MPAVDCRLALINVNRFLCIFSTFSASSVLNRKLSIEGVVSHIYTRAGGGRSELAGGSESNMGMAKGVAVVGSAGEEDLILLGLTDEENYKVKYYAVIHIVV